jgi:pyridoxine kinase
MKQPPLSILSIQSHVAYGHVGNAAAVFPLQRIGCEVWPIHTVQFSNHTGYPDWRGQVFDAKMIDDCMAGIAARGALADCDAILSGYMGSAEIGAAIVRAAAAVRAQNSAAVYCCDPVLGDVGRGLYVKESVAAFMREAALPAATIITPNHFELDLLSGQPATDIDGARRALRALHTRGPSVIVVTSLALDSTPPDAIDMIVSEKDSLWRLRTPKAPISAHGAGDVFAALFLAHWLRTRSAPESIAQAASSVYGLIDATAKSGSRELQIVAAQEQFVRPSRLFAAEKI